MAWVTLLTQAVLKENNMDKEKKVYSASDKLSVGERLNYALGGFGYNIMYIWISGFLTIYYTDVVGVSAAAVSGLLLIVRFYDALNDPIAGLIADNVSGKSGKYKCLLAPFSIILAVSIFLLFSANPAWSSRAKTIWMYVFYISTVTAATFISMPHLALIGRQTINSNERSLLSSFRAMFISIGANIPTILATTLIVFFSASGTKDAQGYSRTVFMFCLIGATVLFVTSRRIIIRVEDPPKEKGKKTSFKEYVRTITQNSPLCFIALAYFIMGCVSYGRYAVLMYYFTYTCGNAGLMSYTGTIGIVTGIVGTLLVPGWIRKIGNKGKATAWLLFICSACYAVSFFFNANMFIWWILTAVTMMLTTAYSACQNSMLPDAIDYGEYVSGTRSDGLSTAIVNFMLKAGGALLPALLLAILGKLGYVPNVEQTETVKTALNFFITMLPAMLMFIMGCLYRFAYKITPELYVKIQKELSARRQRANE